MWVERAEPTATGPIMKRVVNVVMRCELSHDTTRPPRNALIGCVVRGVCVLLDCRNEKIGRSCEHAHDSSPQLPAARVKPLACNFCSGCCLHAAPRRIENRLKSDWPICMITCFAGNLCVLEERKGCRRCSPFSFEPVQAEWASKL